MEKHYTDAIVYTMCILSIGWAIVQTILINRIPMSPDKVKVNILSSSEMAHLRGKDQEKSSENLNSSAEIPQTPEACFLMMKHIASLIKSGAITFLRKEYLYLTIFCSGFAILVYFTAEVNNYPYTTFAFLIGAITSMVCGYIGMLIAVHTNWRTTYACNLSIDDGFHVAFKGGQVLGFALVGIALIVLHILISIYARLFLPETYTDTEEVVHLHR